MSKTILMTGATDGIGQLAAKLLVKDGHKVLLHGRSAEKLAATAAELGVSETYLADMSDLDAVRAMAAEIAAKNDKIDVLINNAGVFKMADPLLPSGMDARFVVNTLAPYVLTKALLPLMGKDARVVNLSSAAQAPVDMAGFAGKTRLDHMAAYSQSKLAITIWTQELAREMPDGPLFVAVNPGSLLASKMVTEGFGVAGNDLMIGADILHRAALSDEFANASGKYFDNDAGRFGPPHGAAADPAHVADVMAMTAQLAAG